MDQVLAGVRVVEVAQWWFVPAAGDTEETADLGHARLNLNITEMPHPSLRTSVQGACATGL